MALHHYLNAYAVADAAAAQAYQMQLGYGATEEESRRIAQVIFRAKFNELFTH